MYVVTLLHEFEYRFRKLYVLLKQGSVTAPHITNSGGRPRPAVATVRVNVINVYALMSIILSAERTARRTRTSVYPNARKFYNHWGLSEEEVYNKCDYMYILQVLSIQNCCYIIKLIRNDVLEFDGHNMLWPKICTIY